MTTTNGLPLSVRVSAGRYTITASDGFPLATTHGQADQESDAILFAAAPELLETLTYLLEQTVEQDEIYGCEQTEGEIDAAIKARAAIAKAKGE